MHEVTEASTGAFPHLILATAGLSEVCDGRELGVDGLPVEPSIVQVYHSLLGVLLITELHINVSHKMVPEVVTDVHFLYFPVLFFHLCEDFLKELIIVLLHLHVADGTGQTIQRLSAVLRVPVDIQQRNCLAKRWLVV